MSSDKILKKSTFGGFKKEGVLNYIEELQAEIDALISDGKIDYVAGSVDNNLTSEVKNALSTLSKDASSFFIMIEEGQIDKRSHNKDQAGAIEMVKRFNDAIAYATQFTLCHPDTLLIVTADHETGAIRKNADGSFSYTSGSHSVSNVPIFPNGAGTEIFHHKSTDNTEIPKFIAKIFGEDAFGSKQAY